MSKVDQGVSLTLVFYGVYLGRNDFSAAPMLGVMSGSITLSSISTVLKPFQVSRWLVVANPKAGGFGATAFALGLKEAMGQAGHNVTLYQTIEDPERSYHTLKLGKLRISLK